MFALAWPWRTLDPSSLWHEISNVRVAVPIASFDVRVTVPIA